MSNLRNPIYYTNIAFVICARLPTIAFKTANTSLIINGAVVALWASDVAFGSDVLSHLGAPKNGRGTKIRAPTVSNFCLQLYFKYSSTLALRSGSPF